MRAPPLPCSMARRLMHACFLHISCLSVSLSVCLSACLSVCLSICLSACLPVSLFVCLSVCMSLCLYVCMSVCLPLPRSRICALLSFRLFAHLSAACLPPSLPPCLPSCLPLPADPSMSVCVRTCACACVRLCPRACCALVCEIGHAAVHRCVGFSYSDDQNAGCTFNDTSSATDNYVRALLSHAPVRVAWSLRAACRRTCSSFLSSIPST